MHEREPRSINLTALQNLIQKVSEIRLISLVGVGRAAHRAVSKLTIPSLVVNRHAAVVSDAGGIRRKLTSRS